MIIIIIIIIIIIVIIIITVIRAPLSKVIPHQTRWIERKSSEVRETEGEELNRATERSKLLEENRKQKTEKKTENRKEKFSFNYLIH